MSHYKLGGEMSHYKLGGRRDVSLKMFTHYLQLNISDYCCGKTMETLPKPISERFKFY